MKIIYSNKFLAKFGDVLGGWWNKHWKPTTVYYPVDGVTMKDPRSMLTAKFEPTPRVQSFLDSINLKTNDEKAYLIHKWLMRDFGGEYKRDSVIWHRTEYWQTPQQTMEMRTYDCEDISLLWLKLAELAGIPLWRCKAYCGDTKAGGHCWPNYLSVEGNRWVSMDLTYYARVLKIEHRGNVQDVRHYQRVWWTFNKKMIWAQHDTVIRHG